MNIKKLFYLKKINIAKLVMLSCIFLFAFFLINTKVNAQATIEILSSTYSGNGNNTDAVEVNGTTYIQGSGISNKDGITFKMTSMYNTINDYTAFAVWESAFSSSSDNADYDRWYIRTYTCKDVDCEEFEELKDEAHVMKDSSGNVIFRADGLTRYYIERESAHYVTGVSGYAETVVNFEKFFTDKEITYTYRIRNSNYLNRADQDGFGYKQIQISYWKASDGSELTENNVTTSQVIEFGLARAISDVSSYSNHNNTSHSSTNPITCGSSSNSDYICVDYVDTNGTPSAATTVTKKTNIYIPTNVIYSHASTTRAKVQENYDDDGKVDMNYVSSNNTTYALNYFCEGTSINLANITYDANNKHSANCGSSNELGTLRKYLYVNAAIVGHKNSNDVTVEDINDITISDFEDVNATTEFLEKPYQVQMTVDSRGNYVLVIRDSFGNTNEVAVIKVMDIINQALIAYFEKGNKTTETVVESDGWKADEYLTNQDVKVTITMSATTVIKEGEPIIAAETTLLDRNYVKNVYFWRVDGSEYVSDVCAEGQKENCAMMPTNSDDIIKLYESTGSGGTVTTLTGVYDDFVGNKLSLYLSSNGRYRFYIETFPGNNTNTNEGENKNPRVELYKIDKEAPEILFGGSTNSFCDGDSCTYGEFTYNYYQGTGNASGSIIDNLTSDGDTDYKITYSKNGIYYTSASEGGNSILASASDNDKWFTYFYALFNSKVYIKENLAYYGSNNTMYAYYYSDALNSTKYTLSDSSLTGISETTYREYIISHNIKYTAYSLSSNPGLSLKEGEPSFDIDRIKIEYFDASETNKTVCEKISAIFNNIDLNNDGVFDQNDCVNYYLDHSIDFKIRITIYDVVQDNVGNYVLGNSSTKDILVDVQDTTAPGFNKIINQYNDGSECRIEIGNTLGVGNQTMDTLLGCYGIVTTSIYNIEDNTFKDLYTQVHTVNTRAHVELFILSLEDGKWISLNNAVNANGYTPNRSGKYAILVIIRDDAAGVTTTFDFTGKEYHGVSIKNSNAKDITVNGNAIATVFSYYVDKKIVVITPESNEKEYGDNDPVFTYCISVNKNNSGIAQFLQAPFTDMSVFTEIGCATVSGGVASLSDEELEELFKGNLYDAATGFGAKITGALTRQESLVYNQVNAFNVGNDYVGLYKIVLGSLNITGEASDDYEIGQDYIIKIDPRVRNNEYQLVTIDGERRDNGVNKCNLVDSQIFNSQVVSGCYGFEEDDDFFVETTIIFTIKQVILNVSAKGSYKEYGEKDPNADKYNYNSTTATLVTGEDAYLKGYVVTGLVNGDNANVVRGVLRREVGEHVGVYSICNYRGLNLSDTELELINNMLIISKEGVDGSSYSTCSVFDAYSETVVNTGNYVNGLIDLGDNHEEYLSSRALYIAPNVKVAWRKTLNALPAGDVDKRNSDYANYVISYTENTFEINPAKLIVQPAPGQRREYSYNGVDEVNPWELVVFGSKTFTGTKLKADGTAEAFNGYTMDSPIYSAEANDSQSQDLGSPDSGSENYNNASEERKDADGNDIWKLIRDGVLYENGFKTNETYSLFEGRISLKDRVAIGGLYKNMNAGWYDYDELVDTTLAIVTNGRSQCSYSNYISDVDKANNGDCRNYNLVIDLDYRNEDGYKDGDTDEDGNEVEVVYKSKLGYCKSTTLGSVSDADIQCSDTQSSKILFEVYRREIILEFNSLLEKIPANSADIVYGYRYDYYFENLFEITTTSVNKNHLENHLFYCYASINDGVVGLSGDCTGNRWYGLTEGDSWANVGLEFHLHSVVSASDSGYYVTGDDKAIPAGRYYVYASISDSGEDNYKFNYLGGTLTIKTKSVRVELTDYSKEYGNVYYNNVTCLKDGSILNTNDLLISDCSDVSNSTTNTYGFVVPQLDDKDTIADNFTGRPIRDSNLANNLFVYTDTNGLQENVGIYAIKVGTIHSKNNNSFNSCSDNFVADETSCVVVSGVNINNYSMINDSVSVLKYYLLKNGTVANNKNYGSDASNTVVNSDDRTLREATLTITPARIDITVSASQTKMYGCSYNSVNTSSLYNYTYLNGYECIETNDSNYDLGYEYTVKGDKDYYIYNQGYYDANYDVDAAPTYTSSAINMVSESAVDSSLLITGALSVGLRSSALNGGVLYRVNMNNFTSTLDYSTLVTAADNAQAQTHYQGQSVGKYAITLGNLNATLTSKLANYVEANNKVCGVDGSPSSTGEGICRNYIVYYYGNSSVSDTHSYSKQDDADTTFKITSRVAFIYADYNSKVYGNLEPNLTKVCDQDMIDNGFCDTLGQEIEYGIGYYYTKYNSLAKAPWVASIEEDDTGDNIYFIASSDNDVQTDVVSGKLSRVGMNNQISKVDDVVGDYNYLFTNVVKTTYAESNYNLNYYYRELDENDNLVVKNGNLDDSINPFIQDDFTTYQEYQAVNSEGGITIEVDGESKEIYFEITLRKITVTLLSFSKVYGIEDNELFYDLGVCATGDQTLAFDEEGNPLCAFNPGRNSTEHGLSPTHQGLYMDEDGVLKQADFKDAFKVYFLRALGENVACSSSAVSGVINGFFPNDETTYNYNLACNSGSYEALGVINQGSGELGYNYEITYVEGVMSILSRNIQVTPDSNQGFQYGSYTYPSLIPAITFKTTIASVNYSRADQKVIGYDLDGSDAQVVIVNRNGSKVDDLGITTTNYGLVNGGATSRICLNNIDGSNTFCINDRQDVYDVGNTETTNSVYVANEDGTVTDDSPTYIFGDVYQNEESTRRALNRKLSSKENERYNRNVGTYTITLGDLVDNNKNDLSGNYKISFTEGVSYIITPANVKITPDEDQSKVYGQADKELMFRVETSYTVNSTQYVTYSENIVKIKDSSGNEVEIIKDSQDRVKVASGSTVILKGFAYYENGDNEYYNYGSIKSSNKSASGGEIAQIGVSGKSFDKYCYDNYDDNGTATKGEIAGCSGQDITFETTNLVLIGYLYVDGYNQKAGEHTIVSGFAVSKNEFNLENYSLSTMDPVVFTIEKLDINLTINNVSKTYGQASDAYKCETGADCSSGYASLTAQDNEGRLEYNFDVSYKNSADIISSGTYDSETMVLMVNSINSNYYTQSEGKEDKNNFLGVSVVRKVDNNDACIIDTDNFGCEDAGNYILSFRKYDVISTLKDGSTRYDDNYNLMYNNSDVEISSVDNDYVVIDFDTNRVDDEITSIDVITTVNGRLSINKRNVDIFVNTNLNSSSANYYEIEQNIEAPKLPIIDNSYNLVGYVYDSSKNYHGIGENASSSSSSADLDSTYTKIVWGDKPNQVRTSDALVGELAYCNEASNGSAYSSNYPVANTYCDDTSKLVYNEDKARVNTNTKDKFIVMTRDTSSARGLKIMSSAASVGVDNNLYESTNYEVLFYPGAIHVKDDIGDPTLIVNKKDYYIEANAINDGGVFKGSNNSVGTILEYLFSGDDDKAYLLASVDENGNLYVTISHTKITISKDALENKFGVGNEGGYPGIVAGVEQTGVYPFISDYAHVASGNDSYFNDIRITSLQELVTTFIEWFDVESYDSGQVINGQYLERKFDKYYYITINKTGTNVAGDIDNTFAINKVGTYAVSFYVMDNAGRVSGNGNIGYLHIIDTTAPEAGELTLYNTPVKCDAECNIKDKWYINASSVALSAFNKYKYDDVNEVYYLDSEGEYIYFAELGNDTSPYKTIESLASKITTINHVDYIDTSAEKYSAMGVIHYSWSNNASGIYLTITGASDNSYTFADNSSKSQWKYYYSIDNGYYWLDYELSAGMEGYSAITSDGIRTIKSLIVDNGVATSVTNTTYTIVYETCFEGCDVIEIPNKVDIGVATYSFTENDIKNSYFSLDENTTCTINSLQTLITCKVEVSGQPTLTKSVALEGNKFTYESNTYILAGDNVLYSTGGYKAKLHHKHVTLDGINYRFDSSAMMLYRDYIGYMGVVTESGQKLVIDNVEYNIYGTELLLGGIKVADIVDYSFTLAGVKYIYVDGFVDTTDETILTTGYYMASVGYQIYQDSFRINGTDYLMSLFVDNKYTINQDKLVLKTTTNYTDTYRLYDKYLLGVSNNYTDRVAASRESVAFRTNITKDIGWLTSTQDTGSTNEELSNYLNVDVDETKYYKDSKIAYLDTTAPEIGSRISFTSDGTTTTVKYGEDWYVYEFGYSNVMDLSVDLTYYLRGVNYKIDKDNLKVIDLDNPSNEYVIEATGLEDANKKYVYQINYNYYYIDENFTRISWLNAYVEKYVGAKDMPSTEGIKGSEVKYYDLNTSIFLGNITGDSSSELQLITNNTRTYESSGIGSNKYVTGGVSSRLYDFVYLGQYEQGIYYKDIDYIVWYVDSDNRVVRLNLNTEFKLCYEEDGKITQDCAQEAIANVIKPIGNKDITYTINYVVRDKAGNASDFAARGVLYATILPSTNVVVNNIAPTPTNSGVTVEDLGDNTYALQANQGVSLDIIESAFSVNYSSYFKNYNKAAVMTIYKGDEIIANNVSGVSLSNYIDSSEIADYTIIYSMKSKYTTALGDKIDISGETITLHLSIGVPEVPQHDMDVVSTITNNSNIVLWSMILGFVGLMASCGVIIFIRKKR